MSSSTPSGPESIAERRRDAGLTQVQLAIRSGCSRASIALLEAGYVPKRSEVLARVLETLDAAERPA